MHYLSIDVRELENEPCLLEGIIPSCNLNLNAGQVRVLEKTTVNLTATRETRGVHVRGCVRADIQMTCARCLDLLPYPLVAEFSQYYQSNTQHRMVGEIALQKKDLDIGFFSGDFIDVSDIVCEQILLNVPMKPLCQDKCKGLCPYCGKNRNHDHCGCEIIMADPRLASLLEFKSRIPEGRSAPRKL